MLDTDATQRSDGAKVGAIAGVVLALIFPPSLLMGAAVGAGAGAIVGNLVKGFMSGDIKKVADELEPGEAGVILVADATFDAGADKLMKRAKKQAKQEVDAQAELTSRRPSTRCRRLTHQSLTCGTRPPKRAASSHDHEGRRSRASGRRPSEDLRRALYASAGSAPGTTSGTGSSMPYLRAK